jgi:hypothetical protein
VTTLPGPIFPVQNFVAQAYAGNLQGIAVSMLTRGGITTNDGQTVQPGRQSKIVNTVIDFLSSTYTGQAVIINLQSVANSQPLDKILMIYVDNELNSQNVTVAFPDTQQYIGVPAFTTGYYPVLTGGQLCTVYNGTSGKVPVTAQSQCSIIFCNFAVPGFLSQETLNITLNSSSGPVVPSIGDQVSTNNLSLTAPLNAAVILDTIAPPQQYVITGILVSLVFAFNDGATASELFSVSLVDNISGDLIRNWHVVALQQVPNSYPVVLCDETGLNLPVQNLELLAFNTVGLSEGSISFSITFAEVSI